MKVSKENNLLEWNANVVTDIDLLKRYLFIQSSDNIHAIKPLPLLVTYYHSSGFLTPSLDHENSYEKLDFNNLLDRTLD